MDNSKIKSEQILLGYEMGLQDGLDVIRNLSTQLPVGSRYTENFRKAISSIQTRIADAKRGKFK